MSPRLWIALALGALFPGFAALAGDGELDPTFGSNGARSVTFQFSDLPGQLVQDYLRVAWVPDVSVLLPGEYWVMGIYLPDSFVANTRVLATARVREDGAMVASYGPYGNGTARTALPMPFIEAIAHTSWVENGVRVHKAYAAGRQPDLMTGEFRLRVCRVGANGAVDIATFGPDGCRTYSLRDLGTTNGGPVLDVVADGDWLYLICERWTTNNANAVLVLRVSARTGDVDTSYGNGGYSVIDYVPGGPDGGYFAKGAVDGQGRLVVAASHGWLWGSTAPAYAGVARLTQAGLPDTSFCPIGGGCALGRPGLHSFGVNQLGIPELTLPDLGGLSVAADRIYFTLQNGNAVSRTHIVALRSDGTIVREFGNNGVAQRPTASPAPRVTSFPVILASPRRTLLIAGEEEATPTTPATAAYTRLGRSGDCAAEFAQPCPRVLAAGTPPIQQMIIDDYDRPLLLTRATSAGTVTLIRLQQQRELLSDGYE